MTCEFENLIVIFGVALVAKNLKYTLLFDKQCLSYSKLPGRKKNRGWKKSIRAERSVNTKEKKHLYKQYGNKRDF